MCTLDWVKPKASVLKGIFDQRTKDLFHPLHYEPTNVTYAAIFSIAVRTCTFTQGKEPLTELFSLEDVSYNHNVI